MPILSDKAVYTLLLAKCVFLLNYYVSLAYLFASCWVELSKLRGIYLTKRHFMLPCGQKITRSRSVTARWRW